MATVWPGSRPRCRNSRATAEARPYSSPKRNRVQLLVFFVEMDVRASGLAEAAQSQDFRQRFSAANLLLEVCDLYRRCRNRRWVPPLRERRLPWIAAPELSSGFSPGVHLPNPERYRLPPPRDQEVARRRRFPVAPSTRRVQDCRDRVLVPGERPRRARPVPRARAIRPAPQAAGAPLPVFVLQPKRLVRVLCRWRSRR